MGDAKYTRMARALAPGALHAGMALDCNELALALECTDAWVARLVCRAFRDRCDRRDASPLSAVQSVARLQLALALGMPLQWARRTPTWRWTATS